MKIRKIVLSIAFFSALSLSGQVNSVSQYSFYGLGEKNNNTNNEFFLMGGLSAATDSIRANEKNPASLSKLLLTNFSVGSSVKINSMMAGDSKTNAKTMNIDYISLAFPLYEKLAVAATLAPYSWVGYKIAAQRDDIKYNHAGDGGLSRANFCVGYEIYKNISLGLGANFIFGKRETESISTESASYMVQEYNLSKYKGFTFKIGGQYDFTTKDNKIGTISIHISPEAKINSTNTRKFSAISNATQRQIVVPDLGDRAKTHITIPTEIGIGACLSEPRVWILGAEYNFVSSGYTDPFVSPKDVEYNSGHTISIGGSYTPRYDAFTNYLRRMTYRAGLYYQKTGLSIRDNSIDDFGITFGVNLPTGGGLSSVSVGAVAGQRGKNVNGLIAERYLGVKVGFSFSDKWFVKSKYN